MIEPLPVRKFGLSICLRSPRPRFGEWDMWRSGQYNKRGIKQIDGFMSELWRIEPEYAIKVDPSLGLLGVLMEPTTVVSKAWEQRLCGGD